MSQQPYCLKKVFFFPKDVFSLNKNVCSNFVQFFLNTCGTFEKNCGQNATKLWFYEVSPQGYLLRIVGILNSRPGGCREVLVSVSESGFPFYFILWAIFMWGYFWSPKLFRSKFFRRKMTCNEYRSKIYYISNKLYILLFILI